MLIEIVLGLTGEKSFGPVTPLFRCAAGTILQATPLWFRTACWLTRRKGGTLVVELQRVLG
jgi:hypothetical protein